MTFALTNSSPEMPSTEDLIAPSTRAYTPRAHSLCTPRAVGLVTSPRTHNDPARNTRALHMRHSRDHILTTHVGSLPRSQVLCDMLLTRDRGEDYDAGEYDRVIADAVRDVVARQRETGIEVPSDGEQSKVSYSTYMMDRLTGFGGDNERRVALDLKDYPEFRQKMGRMTGTPGVPPFVLHRSGGRERPGAPAHRHPQSARRDEGVRCRGSLHERGVARTGDRVPAEQVLPDARSLSRCAQRGDETGVSRHRRRRIAAAGRLP